MKHVMPFVIKFIASFIILFFVLIRFTEISFFDIILTAAILGLFSYLIGDMLILPRTNNTIATIADFGLSFFTIAFMAHILTNLGTGVLMRSAVAALGITIYEAFFHIYLTKRIFPDNEKEERKTYERMQYQTELSEELDADNRKNERND